MLAVWFVVGLGWSLVQTPAGRVVNRSSSESDRPAYFSAQFALSHGCWLLAYPVAGQLGAAIGIGTTAMIMGGAVLVFGVLGAILWPKEDPEMLDHHHEAVSHGHLHSHDAHHQHEHAGWDGTEPHSHPHEHLAGTHRHTFVIDDHHAIWPQSSHA